ncbi:hypothetical protein GH714_010532 [Hevea brasiliensis]|uniref:TF-B3 domain-containing protein n=1 Tax=Hevea brasiliensis TaxID=3981 RepID=A0A6A6N077_HEVBR|nr:hypothetical protein GH714_010532 [Hevea brasiliensis]
MDLGTLEEIPRKFVRRYGSDLSSPALLKVPSGDKWKVELVKCDGEIWLKNGWQEFVEHYSLALGSFIIFEYEQNCLFNVIIIDKSASEIDYPLSITNGDNGKPNLEQEFPEPEIEENENENEFSILCHFSPSRKTKGKSPLPFPQAHKKIKVENPTENVNEHFPTGQFEGMYSKKRTLHGAVTRRKPLTAEEKANAFHKASTNFNRKSYFMIAMPPSFHSRLPVPLNLVAKSTKQGTNKVILQVESRLWPVKLVSKMQLSRGEKGVGRSNSKSNFNKGLGALSRGRRGGIRGGRFNDSTSRGGNGYNQQPRSTDKGLELIKLKPIFDTSYLPLELYDIKSEYVKLGN